MSNVHRESALSPQLQKSGQNIMQNANPGNMQLVPCRWQKSGWKYVEADPGSTKFFGNPNRVNSVGFSPDGTKAKAAAVQEHYAKETRQFYKEDPFATTTYSAYFKPISDKQKESITVEKTLRAAKSPQKQEHDVIHWGGGLHSRQNFNKKKDPMVNWTEVLFKN